MQEIKCPKCGEVFQVDESGYAAIVKQIRDREFQKEVYEREAQFKAHLQTLEKDRQLAIKNAISIKDAEIAELKAQINANAQNNKLTINEAVAVKEKEITALQARLTAYEMEKRLAISEVVFKNEKVLAAKNQELLRLTNQIEANEKENKIREQSIKDGYEEKLRSKDEQIAYYKDFKARQSTKMIGESLEQHCLIEFNKLRATAFQNAYFEKDNDARSGSKGDFIFREYDNEGTEFISIMFEMKNEADETSTKHKNEDFLKELDKDRKEKNCEYAVLVSMLEADSDYYNDGIVDVSYLYDKMYVIRPQFFIPLITLIRNLASKSLEYKKELELIRNQNIDITHFEEDMNKFKNEFGNRYRLASDRFADAIKKIDTTIKNLQDIKRSLELSEDHLRLANQKAEDLTIKNLTKNNPTMAQMFKDLKDNPNKEETKIELIESTNEITD